MFLSRGAVTWRAYAVLLIPALASCSALLDTDSLTDHGGLGGGSALPTSGGNGTLPLGGSSNGGSASGSGGFSALGGTLNVAGTTGDVAGKGGAAIGGSATVGGTTGDSGSTGGGGKAGSGGSATAGSGGSACQYYRDADGDGFGDNGQPAVCTPTAGYVANHTDCDDGNALVYPKAKEYCDGIDNDCAPATPDKCVSGCRGVLSDHSYMVCEIQLSWPESRAACVAEKMDLVQIDDAKEDARVASLMGSIQIVWVGGTDAALPGTWAWPDTSVFYRNNAPAAGKYTNWYTGEPDNLNTEKCTEFWQDGTWGSYVCDNPEWGYVCERN